MITVAELMTEKPKTLSQFNSLADARHLMAKHGFRHIPIVDDEGRLIGLVSQRNILENASATQNLMDREELAKIESGTLLADVMSKNLTTVNTAMTVNDAAHILFSKKFGCLPVVDQDYRLRGIITDHDFVAVTIQLLDMMAESEPLSDEDV